MTTLIKGIVSQLNIFRDKLNDDVLFHMNEIMSEMGVWKPAYEWDMYSAVIHGHLDIVKILHESGEIISHDIVDEAINSGNLKIVEWLYDNIKELSWGDDDMIFAIESGYLNIVKFFHNKQLCYYTPGLMDVASEYGNLEILKFLHENGYWCTEQAMNHAIESGRLDILEFLHENRSEGCDSYAIDYAAFDGLLYILKFIHNNNVEPFTECAMNYAAQEGRLDVVMWLHENRSEGCTTYAMNTAVARGHLDVVVWLCQNRSEGYTKCAVEVAVLAEREDILDVLSQHIHLYKGVDY